MANKPIIICGAGLSGLLLAQGLQKNHIPFHIFERDHSLDARAQGYRIRVSDAGVKALQDNLRPEHFDTFQRTCCARDVAQTNAPSAVLSSQTARPVGSLFPAGGQKNGPLGAIESVLSVDRSCAREVLCRGLEGHLTFDKEFVRFEEGEAGVVVYFSDGSRVAGAALVAADGAWSRIRRQLLPEYRLADTEARLLFGKAVLSRELEKQMHADIQSGLKLLVSPTCKCLLEIMRFDQTQQGAPADYVYWVIFLPATQDLVDGDVLALNPDDTLQLAQKLTKDWNDGFRCLFDSRHVTAAPYRIVTARPSLLPASQIAKGSRVVLIGDAAHAMPPTAALGATSALRDAGVLLECLVEGKEAGYDENFRRFESQMMEYARVALEKSAIGGKVMLGMKAFDELPAVTSH